MAKFHQPQINPFNVPQMVGTGNIVSNYLFNNYDTELTPAKWRQAINAALQYSDLSLLDMVYSYCIQSSPFLVSQINKRLIPMDKRNFALEINGKIDQRLTDEFVGSWWFRTFMRYIVLSRFYGVKEFSIDTKKRVITDFPLRNIDIFNEGLRLGTYQYQEIINAKDYDNLFFFQPETDQDFRLGLLQPISKMMIQMLETYVNWSLLGKRYSFPLTTIGYNANNTEAKKQARIVAQNLDMMSIPIIPFRSEYGNAGRSIYSIEVNPIQTQTNSDAFRVMKELISESRSEIMQLITGGTLLGATEKNTNSENLADIHLSLYNDILDADVRIALQMFNRAENLEKLARLFGNKRIESAKLVEIPDMRVSQRLFTDVGDMMAKQGLKYTAEAFEKVGLSKEDIIDDTKKSQKSVLNGLFRKKSTKNDPKTE